MGWQIAWGVGALCLALLGIMLPVERVVATAIPASIIAQIEARGTPERVIELQQQLREGLGYFRFGCVMLGLWGLALSSTWGWLAHSAAAARFATQKDSPEPGILRKEWRWPVLWAVVMILTSTPLLFHGFEHEELLVLDMLARRGPVISAACQNLPARAAQPGFTVLESLVVKVFGDAEAVVRFPALLLGSVAMFAVFFLARQFGPIFFANMVCAVLATTGFFHFYVTFARGYSPSMTAYLSAIAVLLTLRGSVRWGRWLGLGLLIGYACYSHQAAGVYIAIVCLMFLIERMLLAWKGEPSFANLVAALVHPVVVFGTTVLVLFLLYSAGIPTSRAYTRVFDLTNYYMAYHINWRFLHVMADLWAWCRGVPFAEWVQMGLAAAGVVWLARRSCRVTAYLLAPLLVGVVAFGTLNLFVYPRYFIHFTPAYVLAAVGAVYAGGHRLLHRHPRVSTVGLVIIWLAGSSLSLQRLYAEERCGARAAVRDALEDRKAQTERIMGVLDATITVRHYFPGVTDGGSDSDFWREIRSENPPEYIITMPFGILDIDIPGAREALLDRYEVFRAYPSWLDSDDDQDSVYLLKRK